MRTIGHHILVPNTAIAECPNSHFVTITDSLGLNSTSKSSETDLSVDDRVDMSIEKYKSHRSITAMKRRVMINRQFEFSNIDLLNI